MPVFHVPRVAAWPTTAALACAILLVVGSRDHSAWAAEEAAPRATNPPAERAKAKAAQGALDDALLKDLDNDLLDGAGDLKKRPSAKPRQGADDRDRAPDENADTVDDAELPADADPLMRVSHAMRSAESLMPNVKQRESAEQVQRRIVDELTKLIDQAEKRSSQSSASQGKKQQKTGQRQLVQQPKPRKSGRDSNKPAEDSSDRLGQAEEARPDPQSLKNLMKDAWGHLPQHAREQMQQNSPERFLPQYEILIERYYKRLAEEQGTR
jgi:hypothetical protein